MDLGPRALRRLFTTTAAALAAVVLAGGAGIVSPAAAQVAPLRPGEPVTKVDRLDLTTNRTCAALGSGQLICVGAGAVPDGTNNSNPRSFTSASIDAVGVGAGSANCVRRGSGAMNCWGSWVSNALDPYTVQPSASNVVAVDALSSHVCALRLGGTVACGGSNLYGELGNGTTNYSQNFVPVTGVGNAGQVAVGDGWSCVVLTTGALQCFGANYYARFLPPYPTSSNAPNARITVPTTVTGVANVNSISMWSEHLCALITDGTISCLGAQSRATANAGFGVDGPGPRAVAGVGSARAVAAGFTFGCALIADGTVKCWGSNAKGELGTNIGTGTNTWQAAATVAGLSGVVSIHAGSQHACAVLADGTVKCWGDNVSGQLGLSGTTINVPTVVPQLSFGGRFTPTNPQRLLDTRIAAKPAAGSVTTLQVRGVAGVPVPATANGVLVNVTVDQAEAGGYATVFPCSATPPNSSNLNYGPGQTIPNLAAAPLSAAGTICLYTYAKAHLIVDLAGYYDNAAGSNFNGLNPARILDTRATGKVAANASIEVQVVGVEGVPAGATGVVMNVTVDQPEGGGYVTVYPCTATPPNASNLNFTPGLTIPNLVSVPVSATGKVCLYSSARTHLLADVAGYYGTSGPAFAPVDPIRLLDTRSTAKPAAGQVLRVRVRNTSNGAPADALSVVLNVTVVDPESGGYASVYPCTATPPNASNLNFAQGRTIPNLVMVPISSSDEVCIFTSAAAHFLADLNGHYRPV